MTAFLDSSSIAISKLFLAVSRFWDGKAQIWRAGKYCDLCLVHRIDFKYTTIEASPDLGIPIPVCGTLQDIYLWTVPLPERAIYDPVSPKFVKEIEFDVSSRINVAKRAPLSCETVDCLQIV